MHSSV